MAERLTGLTDRPRPPRLRLASAALGVSAALALTAITGRAAAVSDPNLDWYTIETDHFRVHYAKTYEPIATRIASLAESIHVRLSGPFAYSPKQVTEIVLTDDTDDANGSATAVPYNTIRLFVTAPDDLSPLNDYDDWYLALVTHEYTHILHTDNISGAPAIINAVIGKTLAPNQIQPRWIIEGLAVVSETEHSSAGRLRSNLFDMWLRADVLEDHIAGLDQISSPAIRWPQGNLWYLYGSQFLGWIGQVYGPDTLRAVSVDYGSTLLPWQMNRYIRRATGRTYEELYEGFKDYLKRKYAEQVREVDARGRREGARITQHGATVLYPRFVPPIAKKDPKEEEIVYYRNDLDNRGGLYRIPLGARPGGKPRDEDLVARTNDTSSPAFTPSGDLIFTSVIHWKNVYDRDDLFLLPRGETSPQGEETTRTALTEGLRASAADVSPDGKHIVFVVNNHGTTFLEIAEWNSDGGLTGRRDLVPSGRFEQAYTPRFSPDGEKVAYSVWTAGGYRDVRIVDVATGTFVQVTHDRALDLEPVWSADGRTLYWSSDRSGIFNIYALDLATKKFSQVTNTVSGAFQPAVSADGKTLVYVGYTTAGYDLFRMDLDPKSFLDAPPAPTDRPEPNSEPNAIRMTRHPYNPLFTVAPRSYFFTYEPGNFGSNALTLTATGTDVVGFHSISAAITADPAAPAPAFSFGYSYGRLPVDFSARFFHTYVPRNGYHLNNFVIPYVELQNGVSTGLSLPIDLPFATHVLGLSYSVSSFKGVSLPISKFIDPYAVATTDPPKGTIGVVHLGYSFSNAESSLYAAGPVRGVSVQIGVDVADTALVSDFTLRAFQSSITSYLPMPWPGHQTLALRASGAIASGTYTRSGFYFVGGYNLANTTIIDTLTSSAFNGAFVLRGYPANAYVGREYVLGTAEYRVPIVLVDHGLSTLPFYLRRLDGNLFVDYGGAFDKFDFHGFDFFHDGDLIHHPQLHAAVGAELWLGISVGYYISPQIRLGYARGFSPEAMPGGQFYFLGSSAF